MKIDPKREKLWQKLEAELRKHGLEARQDAKDRSRVFIAHVRFIPWKKETTLQFSYECLDDWRQNEIDAHIAAAKEAHKPTPS